MRFIGQRDAQYLKDLVCASIKFHVVLNDCHQAVHAYGGIDLNPHGILGGAPEPLYLEVLFQPFEEIMRSFS